MRANDHQVGGSHYRREEGGMQPWDLIVQYADNRFLEGNVVRYVDRWRKKDGLEALEKALHYLDKAAEDAALGLLTPMPPLPAGRLMTRTEAVLAFARGNAALTALEVEVIHKTVAWTSIDMLRDAADRLAHFIDMHKQRAARGVVEPAQRPNVLQWALELAQVTAKRATCPRRKVGAVLLDSHGYIMATGYNGPASGQAHCTDFPCPGVGAPSGTGLELCEAIHAEQNALMQCRDIQAIHAAIITTSPCMTCVKMLLNTSCKVIAYGEDYPHAAAARTLWTASGREWIKV